MVMIYFYIFGPFYTFELQILYIKLNIHLPYQRIKNLTPNWAWLEDSGTAVHIATLFCVTVQTV